MRQKEKQQFFLFLLLLFVFGISVAALTVDQLNRVSTPCLDLKKCQTLPLKSPDKYGECEPETLEYAGLWHNKMEIRTEKDCRRTAYVLD